MYYTLYLLLSTCQLTLLDYRFLFGGQFGCVCTIQFQFGHELHCRNWQMPSNGLSACVASVLNGQLIHSPQWTAWWLVVVGNLCCLFKWAYNWCAFLLGVRFVNWQKTAARARTRSVLHHELADGEASSCLELESPSLVGYNLGYYRFVLFTLPLGLSQGAQLTVQLPQLTESEAATPSLFHWQKSRSLHRSECALLSYLREPGEKQACNKIPICSPRCYIVLVVGHLSHSLSPGSFSPSGSGSPMSEVNSGEHYLK